MSSPYVKCCKTSLLSLVAVFIRQYSTVIRNVSSVPCVWLYSYIVVLHADRAMLPVAKHLHICWLGHWFNVPWCNWNIFLISRESQVWSVFRWDMNVEQAREVWDFTQHKVVIAFRYFWITKMPKNLSWKQTACIYLMSVRAMERYWACIVAAAFQGKHSLLSVFKKGVKYHCYTSFWTGVLLPEMECLIHVLLTHHWELVSCYWKWSVWFMYC